MKKFFNIGLIALFAVLTCIAVVSAAKGEYAVSATTSALTIAIGVVKGAGVHTATQVFGLQKYYFSEMETDPLSRAEKELFTYLVDPKRGKAQTKQDLQSGKLKIEKYARCLRFTVGVSTGGRQELLNARTAYSQGAIPSEWHQGQLPSGVNIAISHLRLGFATDATADRPQEDVDFGSITDSWPAALRNGELIISQDGQVLGGALDCAFLGSKAAGFQAAVESDGLELDKPMLFQENKPTKIELFCPQDVTFAATPAYQHIEIAMLGVWVRPRA